MAVLVAAATMLSALGTWLALRYARWRRLVDEPGARRSHVVATPRGGGAGPVLACAVVIAWSGLDGDLAWLDWRWLLAAVLGVALIGAWDDHRPLGAAVRLAVHVAAGAALAAGLADSPGWFVMLLVVAAVAVTVNVWNFMDGINGIAATQAVLVIGTAALLAPPGWATALAALAAAIVAFVPFNFPVARVFMGDVGSGALGLLVVVAAIAAGNGDPGRSGSLLLLFPCAAFLVDASLTLARRAIDGERWWTPHTRHLYQAAARRHGHVPVTLAYGAWSTAGGVIALVMETRAPALIMASLMLWYTAAAVVWAYLQHRFAHGSAAA